MSELFCFPITAGRIPKLFTCSLSQEPLSADESGAKGLEQSFKTGWGLGKLYQSPSSRISTALAHEERVLPGGSLPGKCYVGPAGAPSPLLAWCCDPFSGTVEIQRGPELGFCE